MSDHEMRALERAAAADPSDTVAAERLAAARAREASTGDKDAPTLHVQVWPGLYPIGSSATVTEMREAGKRGKMCRRFSIHDTGHTERPALGDARHWVESMASMTFESFDDVLTLARAVVAACDGYVIREESIRGVDAPRVKLSAGVEGAWHARADEEGVCVSDLTDMHNEPRSITSSAQSKGEAYRLAAKAWRALRDAKTYHEALKILESAGCRLHSYCAVD